LIDVVNNDLLTIEIQQLMIPAEDVASVQTYHSLEHALLMLIKAKYSAIPVLDEKGRVQGTISKTLILDSILGLERIETEKLSERTVEEVMDRGVPRLREADAFFKALELSINRPFICVENNEANFVGLLTRRAILILVYKHFRK